MGRYDPNPKLAPTATIRARTARSQLSPEEQAKTGVADGYTRLSVGIEHIGDILPISIRSLTVVSVLRTCAW